jgi:hypothetical protein
MEHTQTKLNYVEVVEDMVRELRELAEKDKDEAQLYEALRDIQIEVYALRSLIWRRWKSNGIIGEFYPKLPKV